MYVLNKVVSTLPLIKGSKSVGKDEPSFWLIVYVVLFKDVPVTKVLASGGILTSIFTTSPTVDNVVLEPPLIVLKYKSLPDLPLNISLAPPKLTPSSILLSNIASVAPV